MVKLGQNFLADPNLLDAIVRDARLVGGETVLEVGGGEGALTELLAEIAAQVHVIEIDERLREPLEALAGSHPSVRIHWGDAMQTDLAALEPEPTAMVANLPYSIATPLIIRTIAALPRLRTWTVMVQREIADRLRARPGTREYGAPSAVVQLACSVELVRAIDPAVFRPRPRVESALIRLERTGPAADEGTAAVIRGAFAHRRKALARSLELAGVADRARVLRALEAAGQDPRVRAERLRPEDFARLAAELR
jgi:16S rRNA (adenine1518-N6/adenine1519-N6)-dimethyltransferase